MAEAILLSVFGMFASPVIGMLVTESKSYLGRDVAKDLKDLEMTILPELELTILATKHRPPDDIAPLTRWLAHLKDAYIDAARILQEVKCNAKQPALLFLGHGKKRKLLKRLKKLKEVAARANTFRDLLGTARHSRSITSGQRTDKVFGRDAYRESIIEFLLDEQGGRSSSDRYSVVVVTGMEGAGKTTLAQYVFNDERVKKYFDVRMWLCLSQNLDITKLTKQMIECALGRECPNISTLQVLQNKLIATLPKSGNIMVVLDDVWYDVHSGDQQWGGLLAPFASREGLCKIMVTSRSSLLPRNLHGKIIELSDLAPDDFLSFLRYRAIDSLQIDNKQLENEMSRIVNEIAAKMSEMSIQPLEAEVVGNQLYHQPDTIFWQDTLQVVDEFDKIAELFQKIKLFSKTSTLFSDAALEQIN